MEIPWKRDLDYILSANFARFKAPSFVLFPETNTRDQLRCNCTIDISPTSNEPWCMHEYASVDTAYFWQLIITHASPLLWKRLSTVKALRRDRDCLNTPVSPSLVRVYHIEWKFIFGDTLLGLKFKQVLLSEVSESSERSWSTTIWPSMEQTSQTIWSFRWHRYSGAMRAQPIPNLAQATMHWHSSQACRGTHPQPAAKLSRTGPRQFSKLCHKKRLKHLHPLSEVL